jgi:hypothetical protein
LYLHVEKETTFTVASERKMFASWVFPAKIKHVTYSDITDIPSVQLRVHNAALLRQSPLYQSNVDSLLDPKLIHILERSEEQCLIAGTLSATDEESVISTLYEKSQFAVPIILYGNNHTQIAKLKQKAEKLFYMGFTQVGVYAGGLFEWLSLAEIFGVESFPCFVAPGMDPSDNTNAVGYSKSALSSSTQKDKRRQIHFMQILAYGKNMESID